VYLLNVCVVYISIKINRSIMEIKITGRRYLYNKATK